MTSDARTIWYGGMFLRAEHFQQQTRHLERMIRDRVADLAPHRWGFARCTFSEDLLRDGRLDLLQASGVLPDGTPFHIPDTAARPAPLEIPDGAEDEIIYLCVPMARPDVVEVALPPLVGAEYRHLAERRQAPSLVANDAGVDEDGLRIEVSRLNLTLGLSRQDHRHHWVMPVARVLRKTHDRQLEIDPTFIPPVLSIGASPRLCEGLEWLAGELRHFGAILAGAVAQTGAARRHIEAIDYFRLQVLNRALPVVRQHLAERSWHPHDFYLFCLALAGDLATFTADSARPPDFVPPYQHDALHLCFKPVFDELHRSFRALIRIHAIQIPLFDMPQGELATDSLRPEWIDRGQFVLIAKSRKFAKDVLGEHLPNALTIGSADNLRHVVDRNTRGIPTSLMAEIPRGLPFDSNAAYLQLRQNHPDWAEVAISGRLGIFVNAPPADLALELWVLPEGSRS